MEAASCRSRPASPEASSFRSVELDGNDGSALFTQPLEVEQRPPSAEPSSLSMAAAAPATPNRPRPACAASPGPYRGQAASPRRSRHTYVYTADGSVPSMGSNVHSHLEDLRDSVCGSREVIPTPFGPRTLVYADWAASGRLLQPLEVRPRLRASLQIRPLASIQLHLKTASSNHTVFTPLQVGLCIYQKPSPHAYAHIHTSCAGMTLATLKLSGRVQRQGVSSAGSRARGALACMHVCDVELLGSDILRSAPV